MTTPEAREALAGAPTVWLDADDATLVARSPAATGRCSAATRPRRSRGCARARDPLYALVARARVDAGGSLDEVADLVEASAAVAR